MMIYPYGSKESVIMATPEESPQRFQKGKVHPFREL